MVGSADISVWWTGDVGLALGDRIGEKKTNQLLGSGAAFEWPKMEIRRVHPDNPMLFAVPLAGVLERLFEN